MTNPKETFQGNTQVVHTLYGEAIANINNQANIIAQLQLDNARLRELLSDVHLQADYYHMDNGYAIRDSIEEALGETK